MEYYVGPYHYIQISSFSCTSFLELEVQVNNTESPSAPRKKMPVPATSSANNRMENIKEMIFNHAEQLHHQYQRSKSLSTEHLEAISKGLSCILDLGEPVQKGNLKCLFSNDVWSKPTIKYNKYFKTARSPVDDSLINVWSYIINQYNQSGARKAKIYLNQLKGQEDLNDNIGRVFDLYEEILTLVESKKFMLNKANTPKISEGDYVFQIWLPLLSKLFNINNNIIRIKVGETVPEGTTLSKANLYQTHTDINGFKVDLRGV